MFFRQFAIGIATIASLSPAIALASPQDAALNACANALAAKIAAPGAAAPSYKVQYRGSRSESAIVAYYGRDYTFYLRANDAKTGLTLARATCSVDPRGAISLTTDTLPAATLAKTQ
ncbi:MAG TPA: hypothetical protein VGI65_02820 [Steroidobacteraceae bacterium]|jgi:hypothetical protein